MTPIPHRLFITGTDTSIGKTFISSLFLQGLQSHSLQNRRLQSRRIQIRRLQSRRLQSRGLENPELCSHELQNLSLPRRNYQKSELKNPKLKINQLQNPSSVIPTLKTNKKPSNLSPYNTQKNTNSLNSKSSLPDTDLLSHQQPYAFYWKPIQSGSRSPTDTEWIKHHVYIPPSCLLKEAFLLKEPLSPHLSAKMDQVKISLDDLPLPSIKEEDYLIVEGCGGVLVPLNEKDLLIDLLKKWNIPSLVVARSSLGTINHTLLTLKILSSYHLPIWGVILNGPINTPNKEAIEHFGKVPVLAEIPFQKELSPEILQDLFTSHFGKYL